MYVFFLLLISLYFVLIIRKAQAITHAYFQAGQTCVIELKLLLISFVRYLAPAKVPHEK